MRSGAGREGRVGCAGLNKQFGFIQSVLGSQGKVSQKGVTGADLHVLQLSPAALQGMDSRKVSGEAE